ncbi:MAG: hypothetical protein U0804_23780 [Gemmataceae bacterium]
MHTHDPSEEPVFLDCKDDPDYFEGRYEPATPPVGMTWWEGRWPMGGINAVSDLEWWIESVLEEMISLQGYDTLAGIGVGVGIQALKNADRYLGQYGKGDHPPRPPADQLQGVEQVEDALEAVLRYLRQQSQPATAVVGQGAPPPATAEQTPPLRSWTQPKLDAAIREYAARRAGALKSLREAVQGDRKGAVESARDMFGRNEIARALGVKSRAMISKSEAWTEIADDLRLRPRPDGYRGLKRSGKIGFDKAADDKAEAGGDPVADAVEWHEEVGGAGGEMTEKAAIAYVRKHLTGYEANAIIENIESGVVPPERVVKMVKTLLENRDDNRPRRRR